MSAAGARVSIEHVDGSVTDSALPSTISPHQPFVDIRAITHELPGGGAATVRLLGETYEMEDHRNWSDASFKTYCTPITLPFPVEVTPGESLEQSVEVTFAAGTVAALDDEHITLTIHDDVKPLPRLGTSLAANQIRLDETHADALASLQLDHLRVALPEDPHEWLPVLTDAANTARTVGANLRVGVTCSDPADLSGLCTAPADAVDVVDCLYVFSSRDKVTPDGWAPAARDALGSRWAGTPLGGGTDLYFTELNREPPDPSAFDVLNFSLNPQVHAFDDRTLIQNAMAQYVVASDAPRLAAPAKISIAPISLRPRFNPNATDPQSDVSNTPLPGDVDERQRTYFAANWAAMSIKYLAQAGSIEVATYFEATGWKGLMQGPLDPPDPVNFPASAGTSFAVWQVFAALAGMTHTQSCTSSMPETVDVLIAHDGNRRVALIANWSAAEQSIQIPDTDPPSLSPHSLTVINLPTH